MSSQSVSACRSALLTGRIPSHLCQVRWRGSAMATLMEIQRRYDLRCPSESDAVLASVRGKRIEKFFVYISECRSACSRMRVVKIGIAGRVEARELGREKNPLVVWDPAKCIECGSKQIAAMVESSLLASAAVAGFWISNEFVAKGSASMKITQKPFSQSRVKTRSSFQKLMQVSS